MFFHAPRAEFREELHTNKGSQQSAPHAGHGNYRAAASRQPTLFKTPRRLGAYNCAVAAVVTLPEFKLNFVFAKLDPNKCRCLLELLYVQVAILVLVDLFESIPEVVEKDLVTADASGLKHKRLSFMV